MIVAFLADSCKNVSNSRLVRPMPKDNLLHSMRSSFKISDVNCNVKVLQNQQPILRNRSWITKNSTALRKASGSRVYQAHIVSTITNDGLLQILVMNTHTLSRFPLVPSVQYNPSLLFIKQTLLNPCTYGFLPFQWSGTLMKHFRG